MAVFRDAGPASGIPLFHHKPTTVKAIIQQAYLLLHDGKPDEAMRVLENAMIEPQAPKFNHDANSLFEAIGYPEMREKAIDFSHDLFMKLGGGEISRSKMIEEILNTSYPAAVQMEISFHTGKHMGELESMHGHARSVPPGLKDFLEKVISHLEADLGKKPEGK